MTALYEIAAEYKRLEAALTEDGWDEQTISDSLEGSEVGAALEVKASNIEFLARSIVKDVPAIDLEIERLRKLKEQREKAATRLREYIKVNMQAAGIQKIECPLFRISLQNNPPAVEIFEPNLVPPEFMKQPDPPQPTADKRAIKEAMQSGRDVMGCRLVQSQRLSIK